MVRRAAIPPYARREFREAVFEREQRGEWRLAQGRLQDGRYA